MVRSHKPKNHLYICLFSDFGHSFLYVFWSVIVGLSWCSKSDIKITKTRLETIKKKRNAVQKYLKNDIADLVRSGLDTTAYGRVIFPSFLLHAA